MCVRLFDSELIRLVELEPRNHADDARRSKDLCVCFEHVREGRCGKSQNHERTDGRAMGLHSGVVASCCSLDTERLVQKCCCGT